MRDSSKRFLLSACPSLLLAVLLAPLHAEDLPDGVKRVSPSEFQIRRDRMGESVAARPMPQEWWM